MEIIEIKTDEFLGNGKHFLSVVFLLARAWAKHYGLSKVRNSFWLGRDGHKTICFGCRRDSQRRKQTAFENVIRSRATCHF